MVLSSVWYVVELEFIIVYQCVLGCVNNVLLVHVLLLLCWMVHKLFMCLFLQHDSRCRHVSFLGICIGYMLGIYLVGGYIYSRNYLGISLIKNLRFA